MRIGVDARFLTHPQTGGFKTYTENLVRALVAVDHDHEYVFYVDRAPAPHAWIPTGPRVRVTVIASHAPVVGAGLREQVQLPLQARRDRLDLLHCPVLTAPLVSPCPVVVTVHDTFWMDGPPTWPGWFRRRPWEWYHAVVPRLTVTRAAGVITVSEFAKRDICRRLDLAPEQVMVTLEAGSTALRSPAPQEQCEAVRRARAIPGPYVLGLAGPVARKNSAALIEAFAAIPSASRTGVSLVLVGSFEPFLRQLRARADEVGIGGSVHILTGVDDEELRALYSGAEVFAFPSVAEGFGLPVLEAMACGAPVVALPCSSVPEVAGDAAVICAGVGTHELANGLSEVLTNAELRTALKARGVARAQHFSWERCARETVRCYERVMGTAGAASVVVDGAVRASKGGVQ